jgi:hypothetical protein
MNKVSEKKNDEKRLSVEKAMFERRKKSYKPQNGFVLSFFIVLWNE